MFIKIGSGIFNSGDIEAIVFEDGEITITLKGDKKEIDRQYIVDQDCDNIAVLESMVKILNMEAINGV